MKQIKKILILAGDTDGNLGDRAILLSMYKQFREFHPDINIIYLSGNPEQDRKFPGLYPIPRGPGGIPHLIKAAISSDVILCGGGGLFQDDDSLIKMPYWAVKIALLRIFNKKIVGYSLGIGPLEKEFSKLFARLAFACMETISVRDHEARKCSENLTSKEVKVIPDPALQLPEAPQKEAYALLQENGIPMNNTPLIGVAVRRSFHQTASFIPHKYAFKYHLRKIPGKDKCSKMISQLAWVMDQLIREHGAYILFMPTYNVAHEADDLICEEVKRKMEHDRASILRISDPTLYKAVARYLSVMLGGRMHPAILSFSAGVPVVGLSYNQKFLGFFDLINQRDKVIHIEDFVNKHLINELLTLLSGAITGEKTWSPEFTDLSKLLYNFNESILTQ